MKVKDFVQKYLPAAEAVEKSHGIPKLLTLAQAALESAWGDKAPQNNFFGIKAGTAYKGKSQVFDTTEFINGKAKKLKQTFRAYDNPVDCFTDYAEVLKKNWPDAAAMSDPIAAAKALVSGKRKYATDPDYAAKIGKIIGKLKWFAEPKKEVNMKTEKTEIKIIARGVDNIPYRSVFNLEMKPVSLPDAPALNIGTEQLHDVIDYGCDQGFALAKVLEDHKIDKLEIIGLLIPTLKLPRAISGIDQVPSEIGDLSKEELQAEIDFVKAKFSVDNDRAQKIVEAAIKAVYANYLLVKAIKG